MDETLNSRYLFSATRTIVKRLGPIPAIIESVHCYAGGPGMQDISCVIPSLCGNSEITCIKISHEPVCHSTKETAAP